MERLIVRTPAGPLEVEWDGRRIRRARFCRDQPTPLPVPLEEAMTAYWQGREPNFRALVALPTEFARIYSALMDIRAGHTVTYAELARRALGSPRYARLVGRAMRENPIPFFLPCHRVCGRRRRYAYRWGEHRKRQLLRFEEQYFRGGE